MIGILCAMEIEMQRYVELLENKSEELHAGVRYYAGTLMDRDVILCNCGVGKVNAAMHTQILIDRYHPDLIIQNGIAGSLTDSVRQFDLVIGAELVYHDMQEFILEQFEPLEKVYHSDPELVRILREELPAEGVHVGRIATGDQFISDSDSKRRIRSATQALCVEMEGCAVAHTAFLNRIPCLVMRSISDLADDEAQVTFQEFQVVAAHRSAEMILNLLRRL